MPLEYWLTFSIAKIKKFTQKHHHLKSCILSYICCHLSLTQMQVRIKKNGRNCVPLGDGRTENDGDLKFQSVHNVRDLAVNPIVWSHSTYCIYMEIFGVLGNGSDFCFVRFSFYVQL